MGTSSGAAVGLVEEAVGNFIAKWKESGAGERGNFQSFLNELCDLLGVGRPRPSRAVEGENAYVFEKAVRFDDGDGNVTTKFIDLYKRGCFVMEAKQGSSAEEGGVSLFELDTAAKGKHKRGTAVRGTAQWDVAMKKAKGQAAGYVHALPAEEGNPPFVVVVDVGHTFELYADFSRLGKTYSQFPDALNYRIALKDLSDEKVRRRLSTLFEDPLSLDPTRHSAKVTREIAEKLAAAREELRGGGTSRGDGGAPDAVFVHVLRGGRGADRPGADGGAAVHGAAQIASGAAGSVRADGAGRLGADGRWGIQPGDAPQAEAFQRAVVQGVRGAEGE